MLVDGRVARPLIWNLWVPCPRRDEGVAFVSPMAGSSRLFRVAAFRLALNAPENHVGANRFGIFRRQFVRKSDRPIRLQRPTSHNVQPLVVGQRPGKTQVRQDAASLAIQSNPLSFIGSCPAAGPPFPSPSFGGARTMFNPREFQLSAKYSF